MKNETYSRYDTTLLHIIAVLESIDRPDINTIPFEGSWTAGQVTDHVVKSMDNMGHVLRNSTQPTDRPYDQHKAMLEKVFLDYEHKMKSPDFIIPTNDPLEKTELIDKLATIREDTLDAIATLDLTEMCMSFEMPGMGHITRYEFIWFTIYHTQRHTQQLEKIKEVLDRSQEQ
ncbi:DinB family protein [Flavipsychrobacter stenotrophus]|uniref:DinB family protein n=1 Tax=Flavipsychrobacter stenotrophus TaxID=2077091 RepID=A0A2S7SU66_9BACT|nr:DinB family protein [Flavipsychrobacter stenotrophus]PQJ10443.1 DinB family protein [Flavipsychrobacter stenotrophus]